jgi:hypothetical protein
MQRRALPARSTEAPSPGWLGRGSRTRSLPPGNTHRKWTIEAHDAVLAVEDAVLETVAPAARSGCGGWLPTDRAPGPVSVRTQIGLREEWTRSCSWSHMAADRLDEFRQAEAPICTIFR